MVSYNTSLNNTSLNQNPFFKLSHSSNYLYNVYKSSQFKNKSLAIANLFSHNKNSNFKHLLNKLYLEFKEHEPIINKINIDSTRVNVPHEVAKDKITHILKTIFSEFFNGLLSDRSASALHALCNSNGTFQKLRGC